MISMTQEPGERWWHVDDALTRMISIVILATLAKAIGSATRGRLSRG
jgi:hypothetical protein